MNRTDYNSAQSSSFVPVTDSMVQKQDPAGWPMRRRTLDSWGYSPLDQINVGKMKRIWMRGMGPGVQEATPLVYRGMMFLPNPSDLVQGINAATGDLVWEYKRKLPDDVSKAVNTRRRRTDASSPRTTQKPVRSSGAPAPFRAPPNRTTTVGAMFPIASAATSELGWSPASTPP